MAIGRLEFEDGFKISPAGAVGLDMMRLIAGNPDQIQLLAEGRHEIAPKGLVDNEEIFDVTVSPDGTGVLRVFSLDSGLARLGTIDGEVRKTTLEREIKLPEDQVFAGIAGEREGGGIGVFEIVLFIPGSSPKE
jgi:hypothetical protein